MVVGGEELAEDTRGGELVATGKVVGRDERADDTVAVMGDDLVVTKKIVGSDELVVDSVDVKGNRVPEVETLPSTEVLWKADFLRRIGLADVLRITGPFQKPEIFWMSESF